MAPRSDDPRPVGRAVGPVPTIPQATQPSRAEKEDWTIGEPHEVEAAASRAAQSETARGPESGTRNYVSLFVGLAILILAAAATGTVYAYLLAQRAWIGLTDQPQVLIALTDQGMKVRMNLRNFGRTPALRVNTNAALLIDSLRNNRTPSAVLPSARCIAAANGTGALLFPGTASWAITGLEGPIGPDLLQQIAVGQRKLYLVGCISYDDGVALPGHQQPRRTVFCRQFVPESTGPLGVLGSFADCVGGNDAD
ncbi:MAG TPA: hypothetical protein VKV05_14465 [Terriglobales bacterium]|nr:hypothetical protein [Terriglobales bacterium]